MKKLSINQIQEAANELHESSVNMYKFLENLLNWSRIQSGNLRFFFNDYNLKVIIEENILLLSDNIKLKDLKITNEVSEDIWVYTDENMTNSIIRNLLSNAINFTYNGGKINISIKEYDKQKYAICVEDNGVGIDEIMLRSLFSIESKSVRTGTNGEQGSGLGLILCKDFAEKCGGKIWVESVDSQGTKIFVTLMKSSIIG